MTAPEFVIEEVRDLDGVWVDLTALSLEFEDYSRAFRSRTLRDDWAQAWRKQIAPGDDRMVLLARRNEEAIGYLIVEVVRDSQFFDQAFAYLQEAFVRAEARNQGIGRALLTRAENWCQDHGVLDLRLNVWAANVIGTRFWTLAGFAVESVTMKKSLR